MRKASTGMLEQGTQTPSPAPDLIPAKTKTRPRTYITIGTANGGMSLSQFGKTDKPETTIANTSQETLAGMIGTTGSRVSFFMNRFRRLGFIDYHGRDVLQVHRSLLNIVLQD